MLLKKWFNKGKCALGLHKGTWSYIYPNSCKQEMDCEICGPVTQVSHQGYSSWKPGSSNPCLETRQCVRCSDTETRWEHNYNTERPKYTWECNVFVQTCSKCNHEKDKTHFIAKHDWSPWTRNALNEYVRICNRCKKSETKKI